MIALLFPFMVVAGAVLSIGFAAYVWARAVIGFVVFIASQIAGGVDG